MNRNFRTLVEMLRERAQRAPDALACSFLDARRGAPELTYAELDARARAVAARLSRELAAGDRALLIYPAGLEFVTAFFGCLYAGVIAVPVLPPRPGRSMQRIEGILRGAGAVAALTTADGATPSAAARDTALGSVKWLSTDDVPGELADDWRAPSLAPSDVAFLQYTSGSTSDPKGVVVEHGNLLANLELIYRAFGNGPGTVGVSWLPPHHDMGLIGGILEPIYVGVPAHLMSPLRFLQRPLRWLEEITRLRGTTCGGPNFAYALCLERIREEDLDELDLSSWSVAFCGAEPISSDVMRRFADRFARCGFRREALYPCYGLAESTLFVTGREKLAGFDVCAVEPGALDRGAVALAERSGRAIVGSGRAFGDTEVAIVDPETGARCPPDRVGEIWVSGSSVARGYWGRPDETRETFQASLDGAEGKAFLRTGDLGFLRDGQLFVTGRLKDLVIVDGRNVYPHDIEWAIERTRLHSATSSTAAFSIDSPAGERLVILHETERALGPELEALAASMRRVLSEELSLSIHELAFVKPRSILRTSSGKIARSACRAEYLARKLPVVAVCRDGEWSAPSTSVRMERGSAEQLGASWIHNPRPNPRARLRLICFPHGGGGASAYAEWASLVPDTIELRAVQLPGREERRHEPPMSDIDEVLDALTPLVLACVPPPFAFFGHCVGARLAFELARRLRRSGAPEPVHLFLSSHAGPGGGRFPGPVVHLLPDDELIERLRRMGNTPEEILQNRRFMQRFLPLARADARLTEAAEFAPEPPLAYPISAFGGASDPTVAPAGLAAWRHQTTAAFALRVLDGDHFYLHAQRPAVIDALLHDLAA